MLGGEGACVAEGHAWHGGVCGGGCAWQGCVWPGHAWQRVCMAGGRYGKECGGGMHGRGRVWQILRDTVNDRAVRILLECIPVSCIVGYGKRFSLKKNSGLLEEQNISQDSFN